MEESEATVEITKSKVSYKLLLWLSILSFVVSLILLWQGLVKMSNLSTQFETVRKMVYSLVTFQNSGFEMLLISFFLLLISIQLSVYALIAKTK